MTVYHRTTRESADAILAGGFRDGRGRYLTEHEYTGVWVSDVPLDINEGAEGDVLLAIEVTPEAVDPFEWAEEGKTYREFLVPASILNSYAARELSAEEASAAEEESWRRRAGPC